MSRTYIGPFGRILPVSDDSNLSSPDPQPRLAGTTSSRMAAHSLPSPTPLDFGSDLCESFARPQSSTTQMYPRSSHNYPKSRSSDPTRPALHAQQLPPFRELLTATPHFSIQASPYSLPISPADVNASPQQGFVTERTPYAGQPPHHPAIHPGVAQISQFNRPYSSDSSHRLHSPSQQYPSSAASDHGLAFLASHQQEPPRYESVNQRLPQLAPLTFGTQYGSQQALGRSRGSNDAHSASRTGREANMAVKLLPRVLREEDIPGEGRCWVYEDGSVVPKAINGELVTPEWGVTKAGKPRKRLAIACSTCRERKIKCDPQEPRCVQCEKSGRECKFTTA